MSKLVPAEISNSAKLRCRYFKFGPARSAFRAHRLRAPLFGRTACALRFSAAPLARSAFRAHRLRAPLFGRTACALRFSGAPPARFAFRQHRLRAPLFGNAPPARSAFRATACALRFSATPPPRSAFRQRTACALRFSAAPPARFAFRVHRLRASLFGRTALGAQPRSTVQDVNIGSKALSWTVLPASSAGVTAQPANRLAMRLEGSPL
jgi:hypothetical protein